MSIPQSGSFLKKVKNNSGVKNKISAKSSTGVDFPEKIKKIKCGKSNC
jgi:hypothetical protein